MFKILLFIYASLCISLVACDIPTQESDVTEAGPVARSFVTVVGIAQDAGFPQANCKKSCCAEVWSDPSKRRMVSSIAVVDTPSQKFWLIDATPDFKDQLQLLTDLLGSNYELAGVFLTHAHIGHYTGLMHLGLEVMGTKDLPVYAMPRMSSFLSTHGPWSQLVELQNISLRPLQSDSAIVVEEGLLITPFLVPHRDEFSETVGYRIHTESKSLIFIPDIDKWDKWSRDITEEVSRNDYALLDASFYKNGEIPYRDMSQIPHPFVEETMEIFAKADVSVRNKINFIHLNHTNPLLQSDSEERAEIKTQGYQVCYEGQVFSLD